DELARIFDEFYQVPDSGRRNKAGTGLGLSLTKNFVEMHGGTINVQSVPGKGSTFTIRLPRDARGIVIPSESEGPGGAGGALNVVQSRRPPDQVPRSRSG